MIHRPLQIVITFKTLLLAVALLLLTWAVISIRDTLLVVSVGIFLGLVFDGPVRLVERKTRLGRGMSATVTVIGALVVLSLLGLVLMKPLLAGMQSFLKDLPQTVDQLKNSSELGFLKNTGAADNVTSGAQSVSNSVPDALGALVGFAGSIASMALDIFLVTFICLFFLCEVAYLKASLASVLPKGQEEVWLPLWDRVTTMVSRWAIGVVIIAAIAGTTQGLAAYLLGSSYAVALGLIAGFLDMIPNIGATIGGFVLSLTLLAEEGGRALRRAHPPAESGRDRGDKRAEPDRRAARRRVDPGALRARRPAVHARHPDGTARGANQAQLTTDIAGSCTRAAHASRPALPALPTLVCSGGMLFRDASSGRRLLRCSACWHAVAARS